MYHPFNPHTPAGCDGRRRSLLLLRSAAVFFANRKAKGSARPLLCLLFPLAASRSHPDILLWYGITPVGCLSPWLSPFRRHIIPDLYFRRSFCFLLAEKSGRAWRVSFGHVPDKMPHVKPGRTALTTRRRNAPKNSISYPNGKRYSFFKVSAMTSSMFGTAILRAALRSAFIS